MEKTKQPAMRPISEKKNCRFCGGDTATFCGYWKLLSSENYEPVKKNEKAKYSVIIDNCYAHLGCYIHYHRKILMTGVVPLTTHTERTTSPKMIAELMKIHNVPKKRLEQNIAFLKKVIEVYDQVKSD